MTLVRDGLEILHLIWDKKYITSEHTKGLMSPGDKWKSLFLATLLGNETGSHGMQFAFDSFTSILNVK